MATNLTSVAIKDGFQQLLHCDGGLTSTEASVIDGDGTASILSLGTTSATVGGALIVSGNLTVNGSQTILNTATLSVEDNSILLNSNVTGTPSANAGIEIERGDSTNTSIRWNESTDRWQFTNDGSAFYNFPLTSEYSSANTTFTIKDNNQPTTKTIADGKYLQFTSSGSASPAQPTLSGAGTSGDPFVLLTQYITYSAGNSGLVPAAGTSGHYLKHNGAFGQVAFSELSGTTAILTNSSVIGSLANVDSSTPTNGQILKYNTGSSIWVVSDQDTANTTWVLEDGDSTRVTVADSKYVKFVEGGNIDINWTNTANGATDDEYDLTFTATNTNQLTEFYLQDDDGDSIHISHDEYIKFMNGSGITTNWNALDAAGTSGDPHILTITSTTAGTVNAIGVTAPITGGVTLNASSGTIGHSTAAGYTHVPTTASQSGKFLKAVTDYGGSEAWATLTEADISDLGTYLTTSQAQSSYLPKTSPTLTADTTLSMNNGRISARTSAGGASDGLGTAGQVLHSHASGGGVYWGTISSTPSVNIIDGDIHEVNLANKWIKFVEGNSLIDINFTDTSEGATDNPYDLTFTINSGNITSLGTITSGVWNAGAITSSGVGTFAGIINANGGFSRRLDQNAGTNMELRNNSTGTSHYAEMYVGDSVNQLIMGYSHNYHTDEWAGGWVYTGSGKLHLKSANNNIQFFTGGTGNANRALILDTSQNATFYGSIEVTGTATLNTTSNSAGDALKVYSTSNHQYPKIHSNGAYEAMWNYENNVSQWYVGLRTSSQLLGTTGFHFYNTTSSQTVGGFSVTGDFYAIGDILLTTNTKFGNTNSYIRANSVASDLVIYGGNSSAGDIQIFGRRYIGFYDIDDGNATRFLFDTSNGSATFYGDILGTNQELSSGSPLRFTSQGTGTYNRTVMYHGQNSTSGNNLNGVMWEMGRLTDSSSAEIRKFAIGDRGGGIHWICDGSGNTINDGKITAYYGQAAPAELAVLNLGYSGTGETRMIDLKGGWNGGENKTINATHGGGASNLVGTIKFQHDSPGSRISFGRMYHSGDQTSFPVEIISTGSSATLSCTGDIVAYYSDARLKNFHGVIENSLDKVMKLNGYYFTENDKAKELGYDNNRTQVGISAQEVEAVLPELIKEAPIGNGYKTIDYGKLTPLLIEAIKELKQEINELKGIA